MVHDDVLGDRCSRFINGTYRVHLKPNPAGLRHRSKTCPRLGWTLRPSNYGHQLSRTEAQLIESITRPIAGLRAIYAKGGQNARPVLRPMALTPHDNSHQCHKNGNNDKHDDKQYRDGQEIALFIIEPRNQNQGAYNSSQKTEPWRDEIAAGQNNKAGCANYGYY